MPNQSATTARRGREMVLLSKQHWSVYSAGQPAEDPASGRWEKDAPEALAEALRGALGEAGRVEVVVALESDLCLSTRFAAPSARRLRNRSALAYQLEESLPVGVEDIAADFAIDKLDVFAVCCERSWLTKLIESLEAQQIAVRCVCPMPLLAAADYARRAKDFPADRLLALIADRSIDLIEQQNSAPRSWLTMPADTEALSRSLRAGELENQAAPLVLVGRPIDGEESLHNAVRLSFDENGKDSDLIPEAAASTVGRLLAGDEQPPVDLLRGLPIGDGSRSSLLKLELRLVQAAAAILLVCVAACFFRAASLANAAADAAASGQAGIFREVFPDKRVPVGVRSRLASELRRLKGVRGEDGELPVPTPAIEVVHEVLATLPSNLRLRLLEIRVEQGRLYLEGEVRSHGDADRIAAALRRAGFVVDAPSTQQLPEKGVDFRLTADWRPPAEEPNA